MDYYFGDGTGEPTQWQGEADITLGEGSADAISLDFDGDGLRDDALWDSNRDGLADRVVLNHGTAEQQVYSDEGGRGAWATYTGGSGPLVAEIGAGTSLVSAAPESGSHPNGASADGSVPGGEVVLGSLGPIVGDPGSVVPISDWGSLFAEVMGSLDSASAGAAGPGSESARWPSSVVQSPINEPPASAPPSPGSQVPTASVSGGLGGWSAPPPIVAADGSIVVQSGAETMALEDSNGDGVLDTVAPTGPVQPLGSIEAAIVEASPIEKPAEGGSAAEGPASPGS